MNSERRTRILQRVPMERLSAWVDEVRRLGDVQWIKPARPGLVMMRARETVRQEDFYVGEIYVSESTVSVDGEWGYGVAMGNQPERADGLAVLDAVFHSSREKWKSLVREIEDWLVAEEARQEEAWRKEFALVRRSRVDFEMMDEEDGGRDGRSTI
ncbi:phosphonate C-P lyase system protein PhnG [Kyrpidia tusciae]|uniref:Phosphonate C-P lyase system protein PhnG n=1 Tax=Kyrpidia tusciae (strain DSM 2912 / NBRC 15312 / T2) TaxID=562970 RepID=D5WWF0_KYRT2|nr:phosphonate C-P lyase system protein PhnG [Kyrpidia tusciae]ADG07715.1 phosphonate C-P lyase system protein PhnG [Kyrpidia tusciae DSM 2912]